VCAVPAAGVVVETMVALVLARATEKLGGVSLEETQANIADLPAGSGRPEPSAAARVSG